MGRKGQIPHNFADLTGKRFGRLVVVSRAESKNGARWNCVCDCGKETTVYAGNLRRGLTQSCGCYRRECELDRAAKKRTHDESQGTNKTRLYGIWSGMLQRCYNSNVSRFGHYGGRGITVCDEWRSNYEAFRDWALVNGYADDLSIDRIDPNGNYCPENCRWATAQEQASNRRTNRLYTISGVTKTAKEWADCSGIDYHTLMSRLNAGWEIEKALTQAVRRKVDD